MDKNRNKLASVIRRQAAEDGIVLDTLELLNILPSYQMYQSTVSMNLTPTTEREQNLPSYELTPQPSVESTVADHILNSPGYFLQRPNEVASEESEDTDQRQETILGNVHKLKRLSSTNKDVSKLLLLKIYFTEKIGKIGVAPKIIDPLSRELKQGDYIYGFIYITNNTATEIPFDMFAVVLEGTEMDMSPVHSIVQYPSSVSQLLTMFDFAASYNDATVDRLSNEVNSPYIPVQSFDPVDNTRVQLDHSRSLKPKTTYKKFFAFKLPEKLLDSTCEHGLVKHLQLPATLGTSRYETLNIMRKRLKPVDEDKTGGTNATGETVENSKLKFACCANDFAFDDVSVSYSVNARIIGRESNYDSILRSNALLSPTIGSNEYVVASEVSAFLRVIPTTKSIFELNSAMISEEARLIYSSMVERIKEIIARGKEMTQHPPDVRDTSNSLRPTSSSVELNKLSQSYYQKSSLSHTGRNSGRSNYYHAIYAYKKKTVFQSKVLGMAAFNTPRVEYRVSYMQIPKYIKPDSPRPITKVKIPMNIEYFNSENGNSSPPDFKKVSGELIVLTIKSKNAPIPVVIHPDMLFDYKGKGTENFDIITVKRFQSYALELTKLVKEHGGEALDIDKQLMKDVKCLANLHTKYDHLKINHLSIQKDGKEVEGNLISSIPWGTSDTKTTGNRPAKALEYSKNFDIEFDMTNISQSTHNPKDFCLIPEFQSCTLARIYYVRLKFKSPSGEKIYLRVPLLIQNMDSPMYSAE